MTMANRGLHRDEGPVLPEANHQRNEPPAVGATWLTLVTGRNIADSSGARVDAARKRVGIVVPEASSGRIGTMEQPRRHESRQESSFRLSRAFVWIRLRREI